jgi:sterol desaturase/sphingolipid hydroxylase (fatty acid hydroxylase superfamily)
MEQFFIGITLGFVLPVLALWPLERLFPARRDQRVWRPDIHLDFLYWLCLPALRGGLMALALLPALALGLDSGNWFTQGFGPLARQPAWVQVIEFLLVFDLGSYWVHRWFHTDRLWKFHAVHHSSPQLDWLSTVRHHPINDVAFRLGQALPALLLGFSPYVIAWCLPFLTFHSLLIHANVRWRFGPLAKIVVSPAFHHWHHTSQEEGRDKNFAELFPVLDILFGTYHLPTDRQPERYGIHDKSFPAHFLGQLVYPFRTARHEAEVHGGNTEQAR